MGCPCYQLGCNGHNDPRSSVSLSAGFSSLLTSPYYLPFTSLTPTFTSVALLPLHFYSHRSALVLSTRVCCDIQGWLNAHTNEIPRELFQDSLGNDPFRRGATRLRRRWVFHHRGYLNSVRELRFGVEIFTLETRLRLESFTLSIHCSGQHVFPLNCKESVAEYEDPESGASRTELVVWAKAEMKRPWVDKNGASSELR